MHLLKDHVPCQCTNSSCGKIFQHGGLVGGNVKLSGCITSCPYCGSSAKILDGEMVAGQYKTKQLFRFIKDISDEEKLVRLSRVLKAANDNVASEDIVDELSSIDSGFSKFADLFKNIPADRKLSIINTLMTLIALVITTLQFSKDDPTERLVEIEEARFKQEQQKEQSGSNEIESLENQIQVLEQKFEELLSEKKKTEKRKPVKGSLRNKACPCGSNKKTKCCHPYWPNPTVSI
jgi:hypothetical protein